MPTASHRHRPGHDLDARDRVRCRARRRSPPRSRNCARSIRRPGWVEHDPEEIWAATVATVRDAMAKAGADARSDIAGIGITNQRETTRGLGPRHRQADPQCHRLAGPPHRRCLRCACARAGHEAGDRGQAPGCCSIPISRPPRSPGCSTTSTGARAAAEAGKLAFGTIDSFLLWRLTGGKVHATDATNAARTLLLDIGSGAWDADLCELFGVPMALLPEVRDCAGDFGDTDAGLVRRRRSASSACAGDQQAATVGQGCFKPGMMKSTYGTGCFACSTPAPSGSPRATGCSRPSPISSTASALMRWKARSSSPARRCNGCATA